jgi:hypothetical protein
MISIPTMSVTAGMVISLDTVLVATASVLSFFHMRAG